MSLLADADVSPMNLAFVNRFFLQPTIVYLDIFHSDCVIVSRRKNMLSFPFYFHFQDKFSTTYLSHWKRAIVSVGHSWKTILLNETARYYLTSLECEKLFESRSIVADLNLNIRRLRLLVPERACVIKVPFLHKIALLRSFQLLF